VQVSYCDNHYECRRKLQLAYFGENDFDAKLCNGIISHKMFSKSFGRSQLPHKSVNLSFAITNVKKSWWICVGIDFYKTA